MSCPCLHIMHVWEGNQAAMEVKELQEPKGGPQTIKAGRMHISGSANLPITRADSIGEREANPSTIHLCISICGPGHQLHIHLPSEEHHGRGNHQGEKII